MNGIKNLPLCAFAFCCIPQLGWAWEPNADNYVELNCEGWAHAPGELFAIRISTTNGSYGRPQLALKNESGLRWSKPLPNVDMVNSAKAQTECIVAKNRKSLTFELWDQGPGSYRWAIYKFRWDGDNLRYLGWRRKED